MVKRLELDGLKSRREGGVAELSALLRLGPVRRRMFFRTADAQIASGCDPFVPAVLLPAMRGKFDVSIAPAVSRQILKAAERVQEMEFAWHPDWRMTQITAPAAEDASSDHPASSAVGAFFSAGVDSFYTLQKHREEITHLIFVSGFDLPLQRETLRRLILGEVRKTAAQVGLPLIEVETNLREFSDDLYFSWEEQHGAAMAAVGHFLAPSFRKIYIPSSYALPFLLPFGSHPGLDPLWSSETLELVHDGIEATRFDKIGALVAWDTAVENLRVCWQLNEGHYNCCQCRKCLWTMAFLRAHGALARAKSFPSSIDLARLSEQPVVATEHRYRLIQAIATLKEQGKDRELVDALDAALNQRHSLGRVVRGTLLNTYRRVKRFARRCWRAVKFRLRPPRYEA